MGWSPDVIDDRLPPLPIGRLGAATLHAIGMGRQVHRRAGPWVLLAEDGSQVVRVFGGAQAPRTVRPPRLPDLFGGGQPAGHDRDEAPGGRVPRGAVTSGAGVPAPLSEPVPATPVAACEGPAGGVDTLQR